MIHRFVDLPPPAELGTPIWPIMVGTNVSGNTFWRIWTIGEGLAPYEFTNTQKVRSSSTLISDPRLSPDESEVAYGFTEDPAVGANRAQIYVAPINGLSDALLATDSTAPLAATSALGLDWHPSGTPIYFVSFPATLPNSMSVKKVNRDGTGMTTLHTPASSASVLQVSAAPSGDYVAFYATRAANMTVVVMEDDGTNPTVVFTGLPGGTMEFAPAWKNSEDVIAFIDVDTSSPLNAGSIRKVNADGTGLTTLIADTSDEYSHLGQNAWLSDDSALVCLKRTNGTDHLTASQWDVVLVDGTTGTVTNTGFDTGNAATPSTTKHPWVVQTSREPPRIYWTETRAGGRYIVSCLEDLTDYRVDFDPTAYTDGEITYGTFGRGAN